MLLLCYITSLIPEPFMFFFMSYDWVTCDNDIYNNLVIDAIHDIT